MGPNKKASGTVEEMMRDILGFSVSLDSAIEGEGEAENDVHYLRKSNLVCGCGPCLSNRPNDCISPFKKYMGTTIVKMKEVVAAKSSTDDNDANETESDFVEEEDE